MSPATEWKVKMEMYADCREHALSALADIVDHDVEDTCEGVKSALAEIIRHGVSSDKAKAVLASIKWMWASLETKEGEKVHEAESLLKSEKA